MLALHVNYMLNLPIELNADHGGLCNGYKSSPPSRGKEKETVYRRDSARLRKDFYRQDVHSRVEVGTGLGRRPDRAVCPFYSRPGMPCSIMPRRSSKGLRHTNGKTAQL